MSGPLRSIVPIATVLVVLVIAGVAVALLAGPEEPESYPPDSPEGVVQRYLQAIRDRDVERAYDFLSSDIQRDTSREDFRSMTRFAFNTESNQRIRLDEVEIEEERATVRLTVERLTGNGLSFDRYDYQRRVPLVREEGEWRIDDLVTDIASPGAFRRSG